MVHPIIQLVNYWKEYKSYIYKKHQDSFDDTQYLLSFRGFMDWLEDKIIEKEQ